MNTYIYIYVCVCVCADMHIYKRRCVFTKSWSCVHNETRDTYSF